MCVSRLLILICSLLLSYNLAAVFLGGEGALRVEIYDQAFMSAGEPTKKVTHVQVGSRIRKEGDSCWLVNEGDARGGYQVRPNLYEARYTNQHPQILRR